MKETPPKILMICINRRFRADGPSCAARGSEDIAAAIESGVRKRCIAIEVERSVCMSQCPKGPTIKLVPGGRFILGRTLADVPALLDKLEDLCGLLDEEATPPAHLLGN